MAVPAGRPAPRRRRSGGLNRVSGPGMADNAAALRAGSLDAVQLFQPYAEELIASGAGHVWYAAADRGLTAYTALVTRRPLLAVATRRTAAHDAGHGAHAALDGRDAGRRHRPRAGGFLPLCRARYLCRRDRPLSRARTVRRRPGAAARGLRPAAGGHAIRRARSTAPSPFETLRRQFACASRRLPIPAGPAIRTFSSIRLQRDAIREDADEPPADPDRAWQRCARRRARRARWRSRAG